MKLTNDKALINLAHSEMELAKDELIDAEYGGGKEYIKSSIQYLQAAIAHLNKINK